MQAAAKGYHFQACCFQKGFQINQKIQRCKGSKISLTRPHHVHKLNAQHEHEKPWMCLPWFLFCPKSGRPFNGQTTPPAFSEDMRPTQASRCPAFQWPLAGLSARPAVCPNYEHFTCRNHLRPPPFESKFCPRLTCQP